jgi:hypothetical protein
MRIQLYESNPLQAETTPGAKPKKLQRPEGGKNASFNSRQIYSVASWWGFFFQR